MTERIEASNFYSEIDKHEKRLIKDVVDIVLKTVENQDWHGNVALIGGRLNKSGKRKDTDIKVFVQDYSYGVLLTKAVELEITGPERKLAYQRLSNPYNLNIALYLLDPNNLSGTPVHLILPNHWIGSNTLESRLPWHSKRKYAILAEF
ncbi:MAG TPA: hypothetical protein VKC54_04705 [Patescibacteria group bacterium]|nr:hypothetical protein [Patescibacteria group bacterium]